MAGEGLASVSEKATLGAVAAVAAARVRPVSLAGERVLPVLSALETLVPDGLRRGSTVAVSSGPGQAGATSLALALLAGVSAAGSWTAVAGVPSIGLAAAAGFGAAFERLVLVADPPSSAWATVVATLVDAFDLVLVRPGRRVRVGDARRLTSRARERGSVLLLLDDHGQRWPEAADLRLEVVAATWEGLGDGHGHLQARRVTVESGGRRGAARSRRFELWLPAADGGVEAVEPLAPVQPLHVDAGTATGGHRAPETRSGRTVDMAG
jgi:hypothetical protein